MYLPCKSYLVVFDCLLLSGSLVLFEALPGFWLSFVVQGEEVAAAANHN